MGTERALVNQDLEGWPVKIAPIRTFMDLPVTKNALASMEFAKEAFMEMVNVSGNPADPDLAVPIANGDWLNVVANAPSVMSIRFVLPTEASVVNVFLATKEMDLRAPK